MRYSNKNKCKKKCECKKIFKNNCGCNNNNSINNEYCSNCNKFKELAREKCAQADCISNKANRIAQQAKQAEERAECLRQQAIEECERANRLWDEYKELSNEGMCLMQGAKDCLAKAAECYQECYEDDFGCDMENFGVNSDNNSWDCNCNCGCHKHC